MTVKGKTQKHKTNVVSPDASDWPVFKAKARIIRAWRWRTTEPPCAVMTHKGLRAVRETMDYVLQHEDGMYERLSPEFFDAIYEPTRALPSESFLFQTDWIKHRSATRHECTELMPELESAYDDSHDRGDSVDPGRRCAALMILSDGNYTAARANRIPAGVKVSRNRTERPENLLWIAPSIIRLIGYCCAHGHRTAGRTVYCDRFPTALMAGLLLEARIGELICTERPDFGHAKWGRQWGISCQMFAEAGVPITVIS